ncbi:LRRC74B [Bugula neritina]|uniref:LRRC74B n=1 Tax=Bugula neritina TaxID=10212 RepID=A0A7J7JW98_BUGNE|nr:LRRC74B [Bugula neritina]
MVKLQNYITKHNIKLIDFFKKFDVDGNMSLGNNEFRQALEDLGIKLSEDELETLIGELDKDGDGEINTVCCHWYWLKVNCDRKPGSDSRNSQKETGQRHTGF